MTVNFAHCLFEQSGTFRDEFQKMGVPAKDYDLCNEFGKTDNFICDHILGIESGHTQPTLF